MTTEALQREESRPLHIALWVVQSLLFVAFGMAGLMKLFTPIDELALKLPWAAAVPAALVRFIGLSEVAGALGLVLPQAFRVRPQLTPLAALGLVTVMVLAAGFHLHRLEYGAIAFNLVLGALAAFVGWGRARRS